MSESDKSASGVNHEKRDLDPKTEGCLADLPDLNVGDTVRVETEPNYDDMVRTLTVKDDREERGADVLAYNDGGAGYTLSGYGTTYSLSRSTSLTGSWARVDLVWRSKPTGVTVESIEVIDRAE